MTELRLQPGIELAGYRIVRFVARGGMGSVYEATQLSLDRRVALKFISDDLGVDEPFRARFRREARSAAAIDDPHILPVYEAGELPDGRLFLAMRFVDGPDLSTLLQQHGAMELRQALDVLGQVAEALDAAHACGLVHRDVKPANVMLDPRRGSWHAYLTDFGLAKPDEQVSEHTATGELLGTVDYMAPELIDGQPFDARADVYAFGCLAYRCLTGELPYGRETRAATMMAHLNAPIPRPSAIVAGLPPSADLMVEKAMQKDPALRVSSAGALMRWALVEVAPDGGMHNGADERPTEQATLHTATVRAPRARTPRSAPPPVLKPVTSAAAGSAHRTRPALVIAVLALLVAVAAAGVTFGFLARSGDGTAGGHSLANRPAAVVAGGSSSTSSTTGTRTLSRTSTTITGSEANTAAVESESFEGPGYTAEVPAGWSTVEDGAPKQGYTESKWQNRGEAADYALIDASGTQSGKLTPTQEAAPVHRDLEQEPGYEELAYSPIQLGDTPAQEWVFRVAGSQRVDYFFQRCGSGFAVLGSTPASQFQQWAASFRALALSVKGSCE